MNAPLSAAMLVAAQRMPGVQHAMQGDSYGMLLVALLMIAPPMIMIALAKRWKRRGLDMYIRRIPGVDAIEDAVGRTVEMGRPILFTFGLADVGPLFFACLGVLSHIARLAARYSVRLFVPQRDIEVMAITQNAVRECYQAEGRLDRYHEDDIRFLSGAQFAFASGYMGIAHREKAAACFLFGSFAAESLILAEAGQQIGAIQVAGTTDNPQIPFFITTCDFTVIGEEVFAAGAYLSHDPVQHGSLRGQDIAKMLLLLFIVIGILTTTFDPLDMTGGKDWSPYSSNWAQWLLPPRE
ncbi:MAG: hypothetical protein NTW87_15580 [Planctomycetota bacterium]|nr:hypothetical protein [Planctomycetota bacterium]